MLVDYRGEQSGQLDVIIYDASINAPLLRSDEPGRDILPAEAALAVLEVKSLLSGQELASCLHSAARVNRLRPYKRQFARRRRGGIGADDGDPRFAYHVFAYETDLVVNNWPQNEWSRLYSEAEITGVSMDLIDRIMILSRGQLDPEARVAESVSSGDRVSILQWHLALSNFITRETRRRRPVDWQLYSGREQGFWKRIGP
jgi:hypothetical protein